MDQGKQDKEQQDNPQQDNQQHDKQQENQRRMTTQDRNRDMGSRNEEETGKPVQLDKDGKEQQGGQHGGQQQPGGQPRRPETERKPDQAPAQR